MINEPNIRSKRTDFKSYQNKRVCGHVVMCNIYYSAIISPIERITHEFHVSFVITLYYFGTCIGTLVSIHLHTINRNKIELVLIATGISFIICLLVETQLSIESSSFYDYFPLRIVLGALIGFIYLSSVIIVHLQISLSPFTCLFTIATIISITQADASPEICSISLVLLYSLFALNLSSSNCLFPELKNETKNVHTNVQFSAMNLTVKKPLIYLAGAKLLTTFCYFLPFVSIALQIFIQPNALLTDVNNRSQHLFVLLLSRLALGTVTILLARHNVKFNYFSIIYIMPLTTLLAAILLLPLFDLRHLTKYTIEFYIIMTLYVAFSLVVDVIDHRVAFKMDFEFGFVPSNRVIALTFASFIEHLLDLLFSVIYLNDWITAKMIVTSLAIISLSLITHNKLTSMNTPEPDDKTTTNKLII
ncbi:uncharacterized protein LOC116350831 [Contarinia nasturtii]|uniref:uncharacterized protein LOC116350831 n=1 Tax=Contarinia nasturtii TaxID=265458 RepID=UPI0012D397C4|nr:uncharacterized protein LOC116350831 [Contarinia nasturtii]